MNISSFLKTHSLKTQNFLCKYKQALKFVSVLLFFALVGPLFLNWFFYLPSLCPVFNVGWGIEDALSYYGTMVAAVATVVGVYVSIEAAQKNYHEDEVNKVKPYLALTLYHSACNVRLFGDDQNNSSTHEKDNPPSYEEYILDKVCIVIENQQILFKRKLSDEQRKIVETYGIHLRDIGNLEYVIDSGNYIDLPLMIENIGNGAATNMYIGFYRKDDDARGINLYTFKVGQVAHCEIFSNAPKEELFGEYILNMTYGDISGHHYSQRYPITIGAPGNQYGYTIDLNGFQTADESYKNIKNSIG